jgi:hypothetical protein
MRKLTLEEIEILSSRAGFMKIAVENFLMTLTNNPSPEVAIMNLISDARIYKWNNNTVQAIMDGIMLAKG